MIYFQAAEKKKASTEKNAEKNKDAGTTKQVCWDFYGFIRSTANWANSWKLLTL